MKLPGELTPEQIRVLQEFRRLRKEALSVEEVCAIRHPVGGGEEPARQLVTSGYLTRGEEGYRLLEKGSRFLSYDPQPKSRG